VSDATPTTLRQACIIGTRVFSETPRARASSAMPITPTRPRYITISPGP